MAQMLVVTVGGDGHPPFVFAAGDREQAKREVKRLCGDRGVVPVECRRWVRGPVPHFFTPLDGWRLAETFALSLSTRR